MSLFIFIRNFYRRSSNESCVPFFAIMESGVDLSEMGSEESVKKLLKKKFSRWDNGYPYNLVFLFLKYLKTYISSIIGYLFYRFHFFILKKLLMEERFKGIFMRFGYAGTLNSILLFWCFKKRSFDETGKNRFVIFFASYESFVLF
jgi:hypothetical protein